MPSSTAVTELKHAFRAIYRRLRLTAAMVLIQAIAIAAVTVAFGIVGVVFLVPSMVGNTERLGWVFGIDSQRADDRAAVSAPDFLDFESRAHSFEALAARTGGALTMTGRGQATRLVVMRVTANHFKVWALNAVRGRTLLPGEDRPGAPPVVVLTYRFWQARLAGDESIVGQTLMLNGIPHTVVGVMDPRLDWSAFRTIDLWAPLDVESQRQAARDRRVLAVVGLLKPGVTVDEANLELHTIATQLAQEHPLTNKGFDIRVVDTRTGRTGAQTYYNLGLQSVGAVLVLAIGYIDIAFLLLTQGLERQKEFTISLALGARPGRLVFQQALEGLIVGVLGCGAGLLLALTIIQALKVSPDSFYQRIPVDWRLFGFSALVALVTPVIFGILPLIPSTRGQARLTTGSWSEAQSGRSGRRRQRVLAAAQLGAALTVLIVSAIVLRSLVATLRADMGFRTSDLLTVVLDLPAWRYPDSDSSPRFFAELLERVNGMPGVSGASAISALPVLQPAGPSMMVSLEGAPPLAPGTRPSAQIVTVMPNVFSTLGIPLMVGREFTIQDSKAAPLVAVVNRAFAARYVATPELIVGRSVIVRGDQRPRAIVGVVGNVREQDLNVLSPQVYLPLPQDPQRTLTMVFRTSANVSPASLVDLIGKVDRDVAPYQVRTFEEGFTTRQASSLILFGLFGGLALASAVLAAGGLYCVYSCLVAQRSREFSIRLALGATTSEISSLIFVDGVLTLVPGLFFGLAGGALLSRFAVGTFYGVRADPFDPVVYIGCVALVLVSSAAALWVPARRGRRVAVATLLRN